MSFNGDLEYLPIVDVIQLLHASRKSGILRVKSRKGESQLVFKDGYVVSANHLNNTVRIGKILVDLSIITPAGLERGLQLQKEAGRERQPLIVTLIEQGLVKEQDAYKGLEQLIEMTVVEILTWRKGTFTLEVLPKPVADEYRYYPERINREINVDTQSVLMDALRIFDEKMRDGELAEEDVSEDDLLPEEEGPLISVEDLGLADLDRLGKKGPETVPELEGSTSGLSPLGRLADCVARLHGIAEASEVASVVRELVAEMCGRALTLIVHEDELVAGKGTGIEGDGNLGLRLPLTGPSLFRTVIAEGRIHFGPAGAEPALQRLFAAIDAPLRPTVLVLPLKSRGKTLALTYGDFGGREPAPVDTDLLKILAHHADLVLENSLYRKKLAKAGS